MKNGWTLGLLALVLVIGASTATSQVTYERMLEEAQLRYTKITEDGRVVPTQQLERWKWFWEPRLNADGTFPAPMHYLQEIHRVNNRKRSVDVQAIPTWKEVGPFAPDLPGQNNVWSGIGRVNCIAASTTNSLLLWAGSAQGGIWKTTNGGSMWEPVIVAGMPMFGVSDIAIAPSNSNIIYVATGDVDASIPGEVSGFPGFSYGMIKSTDNGATWSSTGLTYEPAQNNLVSRIWVDPRDPNIVVAATYTGIVKSTDGGESWRSVSNSAQFRDLLGNPQTYDVLYATTFTYTGGAEIYRSTDAGDSWQSVTSLGSANRIRLAVTPVEPNIVGAIASRASNNGMEGVYRSTDYGQTFQKMSVSQNLLGWSSGGTDIARGGQGFYDLAMAISPSDANNWIVGGVNAWKSTAMGVNWTLAAHWTGGGGAPWVHADHHYHYYHPLTERLYACNDGGISYSDDYGETWRDMSRGMSIQQYYGLATSDQQPNYTIAGAQDNGTARTLDGNQFYHVLAGDGMATAVDKQDASVVYASQPYGSFYRSDNSGNNWRQIANANSVGEARGAWVSPIVTDTKNSGTIYIGYTELYKSTNYGTSWTKLTSIGANTYLRKIAVAPSDNRYLYIGFDNTMYMSTNGGTSWTEVTGIPGFIQDIEVDPDQPSRAWVAIGGFSSNSKVVEVVNGQTTNITGSGLPNVPANAVVYQKGVLNRLYVGTDVGVFFRDQGTDVWEQYGKDMPTTIVTGMELVKTTNTLRVSTYGRGIWEVAAVQCVADQPAVSIVGPNEVCQGDTITLTASDGFDRYVWSNGETGQELKLANFTQTGDYTVNVVDDNGCRSTSIPVTITIHRAPAKPSISLRGADTLRSSAIGGITQFQWYFNGNIIEGANQREYVATQDGFYTVLAINDEGCTSLSNDFPFGTVSVNDDGLGKGAFVTVHPNPFESTFTVSLPQDLNRTVQVVDMTGAVVFSDNVDDVAASYTIDAGRLAAGAYVVRVTGAGSTLSTTVVKR